MSGKTAVQILTEARELITPRERWTQGALARTVTGGATTCADDGAQWGAGGALVQACGGDYGSVAFSFLFSAMGPHATSIGAFNDTHTHEEVLALFDKAIELAKAGAR